MQFTRRQWQKERETGQKWSQIPRNIWVNRWREQTDEIKSLRFNNIRKKIKLATDKERPGETVKNVKKNWETSKNVKRSSSSAFAPYYHEFGSVLSCKDITKVQSFKRLN